MNPRVIQITPLGNDSLQIVFSNHEVRLFDVKPYLNKNVFEELKDVSLFNSAKVFNGTVTWNNEFDFCPDTFLYIESK